MPRQTPEELLASINASQKVKKRAEEATEMGTQKVEEELDQIIKNVQSDPNSSGEAYELAHNFLDSAAIKLWENSHSLEPVIYLYERYYHENMTKEGTFGTPWEVMAKIAAELHGTDRTTVIDSTVAFLTRHEPQIPHRVEMLAFFADSLDRHGVKSEARQMATILQASAENVLNELPLANSYINRITSAAK